MRFLYTELSPIYTELSLAPAEQRPTLAELMAKMISWRSYVSPPEKDTKSRKGGGDKKGERGVGKRFWMLYENTLNVNLQNCQGFVY